MGKHYTQKQLRSKRKSERFEHESGSRAERLTVRFADFDEGTEEKAVERNTRKANEDYRKNDPEMRNRPMVAFSNLTDQERIIKNAQKFQTENKWPSANQPLIRKMREEKYLQYVYLLEKGLPQSLAKLCNVLESDGLNASYKMVDKDFLHEGEEGNVSLNHLLVYAHEKLDNCYFSGCRNKSHVQQVLKLSMKGVDKAFDDYVNFQLIKQTQLYGADVDASPLVVKERSRRKRMALIDLVGIEPNPGPPRVRSSKNVDLKEMEKQVEPLCAGLVCLCNKWGNCGNKHHLVKSVPPKENKKPKERDGAARRIAAKMILKRTEVEVCGYELDVCHHYLHYHNKSAKEVVKFVQEEIYNESEPNELRVEDYQDALHKEIFEGDMLVEFEQINFEPMADLMPKKDEEVELPPDVSVSEFNASKHKILGVGHVTELIGLKKAYKHKHYCQECNNLFEHTHTFKDAREQAKFKHLCRECFAKKGRKIVSRDEPIDKNVLHDSDVERVDEGEQKSRKIAPPAKAENDTDFDEDPVDSVKSQKMVIVANPLALTLAGKPKDVQEWDYVEAHIRWCYLNAKNNQVCYNTLVSNARHILRQCGVVMDNMSLDRFMGLCRSHLSCDPADVAVSDLYYSRLVDKNKESRVFWGNLLANNLITGSLASLFVDLERPRRSVNDPRVHLVTHFEPCCHIGHNKTQMVMGVPALKEPGEGEFMPHTLTWFDNYDHTKTICESVPHAVGISVNGYWHLPINCCSNAACGFVTRQALPVSDKIQIREELFKMGFSALELVYKEKAGYFQTHNRADCVKMWVDNAREVSGGSKADMYQKLADEATKSFRWSDFTDAKGRYIKADYFVKIEPVKSGPVQDRIITNVDGRMLGEFGPYFCDYIRQFKTHQEGAPFTYVSGMNGVEMGSIFGEMVSRGMHITCVDMNRCDGHMNSEALLAWADHIVRMGVHEDVAEYARVNAKRVIGTFNGKVLEHGKKVTRKIWRGETRGGMPSGISYTSIATSEILMAIFALYMQIHVYLDRQGDDAIRIVKNMLEDDTVFLSVAGTAHTQSGMFDMEFDDDLNGTDVGDMIEFRRQENVKIMFEQMSRLMQLGDDSTIGTMTPVYAEVLKRLYELCGHSADVTCHGQEYDAVDFCSSYFWQVSPGRYVLGPKIARAITRSFLSPKAEYLHREMKKKNGSAEINEAELSANTSDAVVEEYIYTVAFGFRHFQFLPVFGNILAQILLRGERKFGTVKAKQYLFADNPYRVTLESKIDGIDFNLLEAQFASIYGMPSKVFDDLLDIDWNVPGQFLTLGENFDWMAKIDGFASTESDKGSWVKYYNGATLTFRTPGVFRRRGIIASMKNVMTNASDMAYNVANAVGDAWAVVTH